jgi:hypothetical protein
MKKQFLMLVAIVVLALPLKANNFTGQLCEEETLAAIVSQTGEILSCLEILSKEERLAYYATEIFAEQNKQLMEKFDNLSGTSKRYAFSEFKNLLIGSAEKINKQAKVSVMNICDLILTLDLQDCEDTYGFNGSLGYRPSDLWACRANAFLAHERCLAP